MDVFYLYLSDPASFDLIHCYWLYVCLRTISVFSEYFCYGVWVPTVTLICGEAAETIVKAWFYHFSFEHLALCENVTCLFYKYYFGGCSSELAGLFPFPYSRRGLLVIQIGSMIFLSRILYGVIMHIPTVAFVVLLIIEILHLQNVFM